MLRLTLCIYDIDSMHTKQYTLSCPHTARNVAKLGLILDTQIDTAA